MKVLKGILLISFAFALISCRSIQPNSPTPLHVNSVYKHARSEMDFPVTIGKFQRVQITQYSPSGDDVGIGYNLNNPASPVVATIYIYPAPGLVSIGSPPNVVGTAKTLLFQGHLNAVKSEILGAHPDAKIISEDDITLTTDEQPHKGRKVSFEYVSSFGGIQQDSLSQLYLFQKYNWMIKYRITFPKNSSWASEAEVIDLLNKMKWPKKGNS